MPDRPWKAFEREAAELIGGTRFWANSGASMDAEGPLFIAQCKHTKYLSPTTLSVLAVVAEKQGAQKFKAGVVIHKQRLGRGRSSPTLVTMTAATFRQLHGEAPPSEARQPE